MIQERSAPFVLLRVQNLLDVPFRSFYIDIGNSGHLSVSNRSYRLRSGIIVRTSVIEVVHSLLDFRGETDSVEFIPLLQPANRITHFANFPDLRLSIAIFHIDKTLRFSTRGCVVVVIGNVAGAVLDEVIVRVVTCFPNTFAGRGQEGWPFVYRHVQIDGFEKAPAGELAAQIRKDWIRRSLPLLNVKQNIRIVHFEMFDY